MGRSAIHVQAMTHDKPDVIVMRACALAFIAMILIACGGGDEQPTERPVLLPGGGQVKESK